MAYRQIEESFLSNVSEVMNGYNLTRNWFNFRYDNPDKCKAVHTELYLFIVDLWNRLGQKDKFGLSTFNTMELLNIGSRNTYYKVLKDLEDFGFIKTIQKSENQHQSRIVAISKIEQPHKQSLDQATIQAPIQPCEQSPEHIDKQLNNKQVNKETIPFDSFWTLVDKKVDKAKCQKKWSKLKQQEKEMVLTVYPKYVISQPDRQFQKNPLTWLNGECWNDEIIETKKEPKNMGFRPENLY